MNKKFKIIFYTLVIIGYIIGVISGISINKDKYVTSRKCVEYEGPSHCNSYGDCSECVRYDFVTEKESPVTAFYTQGLLGAFIGGWIGVIVSLFEKDKKSNST